MAAQGDEATGSTLRAAGGAAASQAVGGLQVHASPPPMSELFHGASEDGEGGPLGVNPAVLSFIRDEWVSMQMQRRIDEYTSKSSLRILVGSWNCNGKAPPQDLRRWLTQDMGDATQLPDIYAVGLQEMVDLNAASVAFGGGQSAKRAQQWTAQVLATLNAGKDADSLDSFELVAQESLVGVYNGVFCKKKHRPCITDVQCVTCAVGVMGMGNKGGVSVRLRAYDSSVCFVSSHLAAHRENIAGRNADYAAIVAKTRFTAGTTEGRAPPTAALAGIGSYGILDHGIVIWYGDLNYRLRDSVPVKEALDWATGRRGPGGVEQLLAADQLHEEMRQNRAFHGFAEGTITFAPTYKFQVGTDRFEERPDKKHRAPAWCDRVLWRVGSGMRRGETVHPLYYGSVTGEGYTMSDHKPVHCILEATARAVVEDRRRCVRAAVIRELDGALNATRPQCALEPQAVNFGPLLYAQPKTLTVRLENKGRVGAPWRLISKPTHRVLCERWLVVTPRYGLLMPGESVTISVTAMVDTAVARNASVGHCKLEDFLVLRVERGSDFFLAVTADAVPSAFGAALPQLALRAEPMRVAGLRAVRPTGPAATRAGRPAIAPAAASAEDRSQTGGAKSGSAVGTSALAVPKEVWRLVDHMYGALLQRAEGGAGIFQRSAAPPDLAVARDCVDTGAPFPADLPAVATADCLVDLLSSLREPLIPPALFPSASLTQGPSSTTVADYARTVLAALPPVQFNVLVYLVSFLRAVMADPGLSEASGLRPAAVPALAHILSRSSMRAVEHSPFDARMPLAPWGGWGWNGAEAGVDIDGASLAGAELAAGASTDEAVEGEAEAQAGGTRAGVTPPGLRFLPSVLGAPGGALSRVADLGTGWVPTEAEQAVMTGVFTLLLRDGIAAVEAGTAGSRGRKV